MATKATQAQGAQLITTRLLALAAICALLTAGCTSDDNDISGSASRPAASSSSSASDDPSDGTLTKNELTADENDTQIPDVTLLEAMDYPDATVTACTSEVTVKGSLQASWSTSDRAEAGSATRDDIGLSTLYISRPSENDLELDLQVGRLPDSQEFIYSVALRDGMDGVFDYADTTAPTPERFSHEGAGAQLTNLVLPGADGKSVTVNADWTCQR